MFEFVPFPENHFHSKNTFYTIIIEFMKFSDGRCLACTFRAKFIEVSVGINHNVDELLAGTLTQIRLKKEHNILQV